jgi:hypothetical protein
MANPIRRDTTTLKVDNFPLARLNRFKDAIQTKGLTLRDATVDAITDWLEKHTSYQDAPSHVHKTTRGGAWAEVMQDIEERDNRLLKQRLHPLDPGYSDEPDPNKSNEPK